MSGIIAHLFVEGVRAIDLHVIGSLVGNIGDRWLVFRSPAFAPLRLLACALFFKLSKFTIIGEAYGPQLQMETLLSIEETHSFLESLSHIRDEISR